MRCSIILTTMVETDVFDVIHPSLLLKKYFGFLSVKFNKNIYPRSLRTSGTHFLCWSIIQVCILGMLIQLYWTSIQSYSDLQSILEWMNYVLYYILDIALLLTSIISSKYFNKDSIRALNKIARVEQNLKLVGIRLDYGQLQSRSYYIILIHILVNIIHLLTLTYADYISVGDMFVSIYRSIITIYVDYAQISQVVHFCSVVLIAKNMVEKLIIHMEEIITAQLESIEGNNPCGKALTKNEFIQTISVMFEDIFEFLREFVGTLSFQLLFEFGMIFSVITFHTFNLVALILKNKFDDKYITTVWFSICVLLDGIYPLALYIIVSEMYRVKVKSTTTILF